MEHMKAEMGTNFTPTRDLGGAHVIALAECHSPCSYIWMTGRMTNSGSFLVNNASLCFYRPLPCIMCKEILQEAISAREIHHTGEPMRNWIHHEGLELREIRIQKILEIASQLHTTCAHHPKRVRDGFSVLVRLAIRISPKSHCHRDLVICFRFSFWDRCIGPFDTNARQEQRDAWSRKFNRDREIIVQCTSKSGHVGSRIFNVSIRVILEFWEQLWIKFRSRCNRKWKEETFELSNFMDQRQYSEWRGSHGSSLLIAASARILLLRRTLRYSQA